MSFSAATITNDYRAGEVAERHVFMDYITEVVLVLMDPPGGRRHDVIGVDPSTGELRRIELVPVLLHDGTLADVHPMELSRDGRGY